jgi:hypothetical protein
MTCRTGPINTIGFGKMLYRPEVPSGLWCAPETDIRNRQSPLEHAASQLIGKARIAETLGEGGEVLLPTKQISQIGGAQIGIAFECS